MTSAPKAKRPSGQPSSTLLVDMRKFISCLELLATAVPERTTASQLTFFLYAAFHDVRGTPITFNEIRELVGPAIGRSLHTTYRVFLDGNRSTDKKRANGLFWLHAITDPQDNRRKYLHLTETGRRVLDDLFKSLDEIEPLE